MRQSSEERGLLLTIKRAHAARILNRSKHEEYRDPPPRLSGPLRAVMYISGEKVLAGEFTMGPVSGDRTPLGFPLPVSAPIPYVPEIPWASVRERIPDIRRPQMSFRYLWPDNAEDAQLVTLLRRFSVHDRRGL